MFSCGGTISGILVPFRILRTKVISRSTTENEKGAIFGPIRRKFDIIIIRPADSCKSVTQLTCSSHPTLSVLFEATGWDRRARETAPQGNVGQSKRL